MVKLSHLFGKSDLQTDTIIQLGGDVTLGDAVCMVKDRLFRDKLITKCHVCGEVFIIYFYAHEVLNCHRNETVNPGFLNLCGTCTKCCKDGLLSQEKLAQALDFQMWTSDALASSFAKATGDG